MVFLKNKIGSIILKDLHDEDDSFPRSIIVKDPKGIKVAFIAFVIEDDTAISCGVYQAYSMPQNSDMEKLMSVINEEANLGATVMELMASMFKKIFRPVSARFILLSDNDNKTRSIIHEVLSGICETETDWARNPNSGRMIKVWIYKKTR